jgi:hypothetical protein
MLTYVPGPLMTENCKLVTFPQKGGRLMQVTLTQETVGSSGIWQYKIHIRKNNQGILEDINNYNEQYHHIFLEFKYL